MARRQMNGATDSFLYRYWQGRDDAHCEAMTAIDFDKARKAKAAKRRKKAA
jgi:hypothetical protein